MTVQKSFGHTFANVSGVPEAPVSYLKKGSEGSQTGSNSPHLGFSLWIDFWREPLKEGLRLNTSYLIQ